MAPRLLRDQPLAIVVLLAVVLPIGYGALCGVMLGISETWFQVLVLLSGGGGVLAGVDHATPRAGALRGLLGGALFGTSLAIAFALRARAQLAWQPAPLPVMAIVDTLAGSALGALGSALRRRVWPAPESPR